MDALPHHHRLVLNGPPAAVARLAAELRAAGAHPASRSGEPPRLIWATTTAGVLEAVCARHRAVSVGVERFGALGDVLERLVVCASEVTVLDRRTIGGVEVGGCASDLPPPPGATELLRRAASVLDAIPIMLGPGFAGTALDDALLVGLAIGNLSAHAGDPLSTDGPSPAVLRAVGELGAVGLTVGANASGPSGDAELAFERAWRLTHAAACAASEAWWTTPEDADWPDWLMFLLSAGAEVIEACAACLHRPPPDVKALHVEHHATADEHLDAAAGILAVATLQALALFGGAEVGAS